MLNLRFEKNVARECEWHLQWLLQFAYFLVEDFVLDDIEVHCKEARLQGGAEGVALHQANLGIGRLVAEQVFLRGNHILQHLEKD